MAKRYADLLFPIRQRRRVSIKDHQNNQEKNNTTRRASQTFCMGAASTTNHRDIISVRHNNATFPIITAHHARRRSEKEKVLEATPLFVFFNRCW
jgi:hypothetical protein